MNFSSAQEESYQGERGRRAELFMKMEERR
jgi:hypothetical protein